jgi:hypothetical protein
MQATSPDNTLDAGYFPYIIPLLSKEALNYASQSYFRVLFPKVTSAPKPEFNLGFKEIFGKHCHRGRERRIINWER